MKEDFFKAYVPFHPPTIPNKLTSTQFHICNFNTLTSSQSTLKCAFGLPIHSHPASFNSNVPLHHSQSQLTFNTCKCVRLHSSNLNKVLFNPNVHRCTQQHLNWYVSTQMPLILSITHNMHSMPSNWMHFNSNDLQYTKRRPNALNQLEAPCKCIKYAFKQHKHSNKHLQPPNVHLYTSNALISKPTSTKHCLKYAPMHLQHEASQMLLQTKENE